SHGKGRAGRQKWQAWVEVWVERSRVLRAPTGTHSVNLNRGICRACLGQPREGHHSPVAESNECRIPAPVRHVLHVRKSVARRVENRTGQRSVERVILERTAVDEGASIRQEHHAIAEHVPGNREPLCIVFSRWVPEKGSRAIRLTIRRARRTPALGCRAVTRSCYDQYLAVRQ